MVDEAPLGSCEFLPTGAPFGKASRTYGAYLLFGAKPQWVRTLIGVEYARPATTGGVGRFGVDLRPLSFTRNRQAGVPIPAEPARRSTVLLETIETIVRDGLG